MIKLVDGDLLKATENLIVHQVNCQGEMNSGIAEQVKKQFPSAYNDYIRYTRHKYPNQLLGDILVSGIGENRAIVHLFAQETYGYDGKRYTSYDAFYEGLLRIKEAIRWNSLSVAFPYNIGCDRGGADWLIISNMIQTVFEGFSVTIYKYNK
jgi:O-acetyl-ADP-ribose deacetylase (regulator of RNase III)